MGSVVTKHRRRKEAVRKSVYRQRRSSGCRNLKWGDINDYSDEIPAVPYSPDFYHDHVLIMTPVGSSLIHLSIPGFLSRNERRSQESNFSLTERVPAVKLEKVVPILSAITPHNSAKLGWAALSRNLREFLFSCELFQYRQRHWNCCLNFDASGRSPHLRILSVTPAVLELMVLVF
jgi:hypothetical protein